MPINLPIEFHCDADGCVVTMRIQQTPGVVRLPVQIGTNIRATPPGWTLRADGALFCPEHKPRLVEPVASLQDLGFKVHNGGKAR